MGISDYHDGATSIIKSENGFIVAGYARRDAYLMEIDELGNVLWKDKYHISDQQDLITDIKYIDGKIVACGYGYYEGTGNFLEFFFKYDIASHSFDWIKKSKLTLKPATIQILPNGNFLLTGDEIYLEEFKIFLMELNPKNGKMLQYSSWFFTGNESASTSLIHGNHIYLGGRYALEKKIDKYRGAISKFDFDFGEVWSNYYLNKKESFSRNYLNKLIVDNNEIVSLYSTNNRGISNFYTISLAKQTLDGKMLWAKEFGIEGFVNLCVRDIKAAHDGYYIYGATISPSEELFIIKTDTAGKLLWSKSYGGKYSDNFRTDQGNFIEITDKYIYAIGQTKSLNREEDYNSVLMKLNIDGSSDSKCWGQDIVVKSKDFSTLVQGGITLNGSDSLFMNNNLSYKKAVIKEDLIYPFYCFPKLANNDYDTITIEKSIEIEFLSNDVLPEGLQVTKTIVSKPNFGNATIVNHKIVYDRTSDVCQKDSFKYVLSTTKSSDTAIVYVFSLRKDETQNPIVVKVLPIDGGIVLSGKIDGEDLIYNWSHGELTANVKVQTPGNYNLIINKNECLSQKTFVVKENPFSFENVATTNITFMIDASISMNRSNRLPVLKKALYKVLNFMREEDKLSIINYSNDAQVIFDGINATEIDLIQTKIDSLYSKGNSNIKDGLKMAIKTAENNFSKGGNNRIIFTTDGDISNEARLELIELLKKSLKEGISFTLFLFNEATVFKDQMKSVIDEVDEKLYVITPENVEEILLKEFKAVRK